MRIRASLVLACLLRVGPALAQTTTAPAPGDATAAPTAPASPEDSTAAAVPAAPQTYDDTADTRGDAMRAYQKALDSKKLAASVPLSIQRLRDELPNIEDFEDFAGSSVEVTEEDPKTDIVPGEEVDEIEAAIIDDEPDEDDE